MLTVSPGSCQCLAHSLKQLITLQNVFWSEDLCPLSYSFRRDIVLILTTYRVTRPHFPRLLSPTIVGNALTVGGIVTGAPAMHSRWGGKFQHLAKSQQTVVLHRPSALDFDILTVSRMQMSSVTQMQPVSHLRTLHE